MILLVGLGNPTAEYALTRHNIGWQIIDSLKEKYTFPEFKKNEKANCLLTKKIIADKQVLLAKPLTFMNASGKTVSYLQRYYKIQTKNIFVVHDELDINFGNLKLNYNRGAGGHKGVASIKELLQTPAFHRLRVGIKPQKPLNLSTEKFVLANFSKTEQKRLPEIISLAVVTLITAISASPERAMNQTNK